MQLAYTPRAIHKIETEAQKPLVELIQVFSMNTLLLLVREGLGTDEDGAFDAIDKYLTSDKKHDTMTLFVDILEGLQAKGFLPRALQTSQMREQLSNLGAVEQQHAPQEENTSTNIGKEEKTQQ